MLFRACIGLWAALVLCSCASVSVKRQQYLSPDLPHRVPQKILVRPLAFYTPEVAVGRDGERLREFQYDFQEKFTRELSESLASHVGRVQAIAATAPLPRGPYWVITGRFDRVHQGSRLIRALVGFGWGATKLETSIVVTDLSGAKPRSFLLIETTGGSNALPGVVTSTGYVLGGVTSVAGGGKLLDSSRTGLSFDAKRTADEVSAALSEYLYQQGAIPYDTAVAPKRTTAVTILPYSTPTSR
jgi:Domain of unknown function (DUF4410)